MTRRIVLVVSLLAVSLLSAPARAQTVPATIAPSPIPTNTPLRGLPTIPRFPNTPWLGTRTPTLAVTATPDSCPNAPPLRLRIGERGRVSISDPRPLNMRAGPGTSNEVVGQMPALGLFFVLDGPRCSQRYSWYQVEYRSDGETVVGWIAEGETGVYFVEPYPPGG